MVDVHIDLSIFTPSEAVGMISGTISVPTVPLIGDTIALPEPVAIGPFLTVASRSLFANREDQIIALTLGDVTFDTNDEAKKFIADVESVGLFADIWADFLE